MEKVTDDGKPLDANLLATIRQAVREEIQAVVRNGSSEQDPYLTVKEAAETSCLAISTIRLYIRKGRLRAHRVGRRVVVKRDDLQKFVEAHSTQPVID